jgi:hypothetical protein
MKISHLRNFKWLILYIYSQGHKKIKKNTEFILTISKAGQPKRATAFQCHSSISDCGNGFNH